MNENNSANDYEVQINPQQPDLLQITDVEAGKTIQVTLQEAVNLIALMYKHRDELRALRTGEPL